MINNISYREAATYQNHSSLFTITLNPGNYQVTKEPYYYIEKPVVTPETLNNDVILRANKTTILDMVTLSIDQPGLLWLSGRVSSLPFPKYRDRDNSYHVEFPTYKLQINNRTLLANKTDIFSFFLATPVNAGIYHIKVTGLVTDNNWCSCPSLEDGFLLSHGLWAWTADADADADADDNINKYINKEITSNELIVKNNLLASILSMLLFKNKAI